MLMSRPLTSESVALLSTVADTCGVVSVSGESPEFIPVGSPVDYGTDDIPIHLLATPVRREGINDITIEHILIIIILFVILIAIHILTLL